MKKSLLSLTLLVLSLCASAQGVGKYVGGDISMLPKYEAAGDKYLDGDGNEISDLITWLTTECGWNTFRVRLFVNPQGRAKLTIALAKGKHHYDKRESIKAKDSRRDMERELA